jgi:integrase
MNALQPASPAPLQPQTAEVFDEWAAQVARSVAASSARIYRQTYDAWQVWCVEAGIDPLALRPGDVVDFLASADTTKATRQRQLSAFRKLAEMRYILRPDDDSRRIMEALRVIKAPVTDAAGHEREGHALTPSEADKLLRVWNGSKLRDIRNRALIGLILLSGLRRSEAAALRWRDIDFENGVLRVRHGKGDRARDVPMAGDFALSALERWKTYSPARDWVFCAVTKGNKHGADRPISGTDVYRVVVATGQRAGVDWKPHDGRRTFITEALATGTPLATVQAAAGHAQGATTLRYAQAVDARKARHELRLRYG